MSKIAFITGASSGFGALYAEQLADDGYNLIITARREEKLNALAERLRREKNVEVEVLLADLTNDEDVKRLSDRISTCENLDILVNNAGFAANECYPDSEIENDIAIVKVHILATLRLTHSAIRVFRERNAGKVVNVASVAGFLNCHEAGTYSATKNYLIEFSKMLQANLLCENIRIQALCPGFAHTEFHDAELMRGFNKSGTPSWSWLSGDFVVKKSLAALKKKRHKVVIIPSLRYKLMVWLLIKSPLFNPIVNHCAKKQKQKKKKLKNDE